MNKNVVLITIDCLRSDHIGCMGYERNTSPTIDRLAEKGTLFKQAIAQGGTTQPSFQSILTSTYPFMFNTYRNFTRYRDPISEVLTNNDFVTAAFHENPQISRYYGFDRGFQTYEDFMSIDRKLEGKSNHLFSFIRDKLKKNLKNLLRELERESKFLQRFRRTSVGKKIEDILGLRNVATAEEINDKAINWLENYKKENFFLWLHYMDVHMPLIPPLNFLHQFSNSPEALDSTGIKKKANSLGLSESELNELIDLYDAEVRHVDAAIKKITDKLKDLGLFENTLLIIMADHGEELLDHGQIGHINASLYDEIIKVPLIFHNAELKDSVVNDQVELLDIAPTILDCLNLDVPESYIGISLTKKNRKNTNKKQAISQYAQLDEKECVKLGTRKVSWRAENWKFIYDEGTHDHELYKISEDSDETENLYTTREEIAEELRNKVKNHLNLEKKFAERITTGLEKEKIEAKAEKLSEK